MPEETPLLAGYFPLWGLAFDDDGAGLIGSSDDIHVMGYIPGIEEWRMVQKTDVWMERYKAGENIEGSQPPFCINTLTQRGNDPKILDETIYAMLNLGQDAVLALRLHKPGWFLEPHLAETTFRYEFNNTRLTGPYRQIFTAGVPADLPAGRYELHLNELSLQKDQTAPVSKLWAMVHRYRSGKPDTSAEIAIENFNRSYGYQLKNTQRLAFLFTALDALLGGMSARRIGTAKLSVAFARRVESVLQQAQGAGFAQTEALWLNEGVSGGRALRNAIAHGRPSRVEHLAAQNFERLQMIIRLLLRYYLNFIIEWNEHSEDWRQKYNLPENCTAMLALNLMSGSAIGLPEVYA